MNSPHPKRTLSSALVGVCALSLLGSSFMVPAQAADAPARDISVQAQQTAGIPGQYQASYSAKNNKMWVTGSFGRNMTVSSLARVNPETMKIEAVAELPTVRFGSGKSSGYSYMGVYGVAVDDANNKVWVTNTRNDSISVYDQDSMELVWTSYDYFATDTDVEHPRSIIIDNKRNKAYVTGRYNVWSIDLTSHEVKNLAIKPESDVRVLTMNPTIDETTGKLYVPERSSGTVQIVDLDTFSLESEFTVHADDPAADTLPSAVAIDHSLNEIFISSQGKDGANSGVTVYDLNTHEYKKSIPFGTRSLGIVNDEDRDLVYVADFGQGSVGVIDAAAGQLVAEVNTGDSKTNDLAMAADGSVFAVDKNPYKTGLSVPFALDFATGQNAPGTTTLSKGKQVDIEVNSFTRLTVDAKDATLPEAEKSTETTDGVTVTGVKAVQEGQALEFSGTGWTTEDGKGSVIVAKLDDGGVSVNEPVKNPVTGDPIKNKTVYGAVAADEQGNWTLTMPFPTQDNSSVEPQEWAAGTEHNVRFLTGSMAKNDKRRSVGFKFTVAAPQATTPVSPKKIDPAQVDFQGYPELTKTTDQDFVTVSFKDVPDSLMFQQEIMWVAEHGVAKGWPDNTYRPFENIERGAMAAYMYRLAGSPRYHAPEVSPFSDVSTDHPFYKEIAWLQQAGITTGWPDGTFRPSESINRDAMAAFFYRAAGSPDYTPSGDGAFKDVQSSTAFYKEISWLKDQGITTGWPDETFRPLTPIKRDAMAAFVYRYQDKLDVEASAK
ncbi:S-layer homology domain-containing protein [Rothia sp. CCM 9416]|uniref:S-layer homology domain-containing protein n=1 Tax=Rothia sp. CCM 9416 TaxID=3402655 RepID=UPI003AE8837A